jgi:hypothetical protein
VVGFCLVCFNIDIFRVSPCTVRIVFDLDNPRFSGLNRLFGSFWDGAAAATSRVFDNQWLVARVFEFEKSNAVAA